MRFLLFDRIVAAERGRRIQAVKSVDLDAGQAVLPGTLVVEGLAQLGGMLNLFNHGFSVEMLLVLVDGARLTRQVRHGDLLTLEVLMLYDHPYGATMRGAGLVGETPVVSVERMVYAHEVVTDPATVRRNRTRFAYHSRAAGIAPEPEP